MGKHDFNPFGKHTPPLDGVAYTDQELWARRTRDTKVYLTVMRRQMDRDQRELRRNPLARLLGIR